jgi:hypothetical protein
MAGLLNFTPLYSQPATADTTTISTLNGKKYGGKAYLSRSVGVTDDKWWPIGTSQAMPGTATAGQTVDYPLGGLVIVPPGYIFSVALLGTNGTMTGTCGIRWHELIIPNAT